MTKLNRIALAAGLVLLLLTPVSKVFALLGFTVISITLSMGAAKLFHPHTHITGRIVPRTTEDEVPSSALQAQGEPPSKNEKISSKNADFF